MLITNVHIKRDYKRFIVLMLIYSLFDSVSDTDVTIMLEARGTSDFFLQIFLFLLILNFNQSNM